MGGIVAIGDVITASVPRAELEEPVQTALAGVAGREATSVDSLLARMPPATATLGPAHLFYPPANFEPPDVESEKAEGTEIARLLAAAASEDLDESGFANIESAAFVSRASDGAVASACGYRRWPNGVAHLSVLTHPEHRRRGHGRRAAAAAALNAVAEGRFRSGARGRSLPSGLRSSWTWSAWVLNSGSSSSAVSLLCADGYETGFVARR